MCKAWILKAKIRFCEMAIQFWSIVEEWANRMEMKRND